MPTAIDLEIGKSAVRARLVTPQQFDECVEVLTSLERKGAQRNLLSIMIERGYLTAETAKKIPGLSEAAVDRATLAAGAAMTPPPGAKQTGAGSSASDDETSSGIRSLSALRTPKSGAKLSSYAFLNMMGGGRSEVFFLPEKPVAIGRDAANDIVVDDEPVSKRHARLTFSNNDMTLWDVGSRNGTLVNGERVTNRKLAPGDVVSVGKARLIFSKNVKPDGGLTGKLAPDGADAGAQAVFAGKAGFKPGEKFYLGNGPLFVGREKNNNVVIESPDVSAFHAQIAKTSEGVKIQDLNSASGTFVNGEKVAIAVLELDDVITIGKAELYCSEILGKRGTGTPKTAKAGAVRKSTGHSTIITDVVGKGAEGRPSGLGAELLRELEEQAAGGPPKAVGPRTPTPPPRVPTALRMTCLAGPVKDKSFPLGKKTLTVGRNPMADIFLEDLSVSRDHAMIRPVEGRVEIADLNSRNGVEVNGKRVKTQVLRAGDKVAIGKCLFVVEAV